MKFKFYATYDTNKVVREYSNALIKETDFEDGERVEVTIESVKRRSLAHNSTLHWWIGLIAEFTGNDASVVKGQLKFKFLKFPLLDKDGNEVGNEDGEVIYEIKSTASLKTHEFSKFLDEIRLWAIEVLDYELPLPDKTIKLKLK